MRLHGRPAPPPAALAGAVLVLFLLLVALVTVVSNPPGSTPPEADAAGAAGKAERTSGRLPTVVPPPPAAGEPWSGFAFDACRAPSQRVMDSWRTSSPFTGVGFYVGGVHRACEQRHLTPRWVTRQTRSGWRLLPIWVGPQASCTGYDHRIISRPGRLGRYGEARARGVLEARRAARTAQALGLARGEVVFYDLEPFDTGLARCRQSSLAFLAEWTNEIHRRGYRSGVYSHVNSGIQLLSRTGRGYPRPDAVWYAWIDRAGSIPSEHVADATFMHESRVHQYALDQRVEFGGHEMDIDWNFVSLGATREALSPPGCDQRADRVRPQRVGRGDRGPVVRVVQCLVLPGQPHPTKTTGRYDATTSRAVLRFQERRGLEATGDVNRRTWTSLLARGTTPALKKGASGEQVRRLQRSLNVALARPSVVVDGSYGRATVRAVRTYRTRLGLRSDGVVTDRVWKALGRGAVLPRRTGPRA